MMMPHVNGALSGNLPAAQQPKDPIRDSESLLPWDGSYSLPRIVVEQRDGRQGDYEGQMT